MALNKQQDEKGALYGYLSDEVFLTDLAPYFARNRVFAGLGYQVSSQALVQAGYMHQFEYAPGNKTKKGFLQVGISINLPGGNEPANSHNANED